MILVFTHETGIYAWYWYLRAILIFTHYTGIYVQCWYLHTILVFTCDTGIYVWYWYLYKVLVFMHNIVIYVRYWPVYACTYSWFRNFQVACLKQNTHVNKITNQSCYINAVAILLANSITWAFVFADNQPEKDSIDISNAVVDWSHVSMY